MHETQNGHPLPKGLEWRIVKFKNIVQNCQAGLVRTVAEVSEDSNHGYAYIKMNNLDNFGKLNFNKSNYTSASSQEYEKYKLEKYDILFNVRNSFELVGKVGIYEGNLDKAIYNHMLLRIRLKRDLINPHFLIYMMLNVGFQKELNKIKKGTTNIVAIYQGDLMEIDIPLPSLSEQQRIVHKLDAAFRRLDEAIRLQQQNLARIATLKKTVLEEVFGNGNWESKLLGAIADFRNGINYSKSSKGEKIKIVGVKDFQSNYWIPYNDLMSVTIDGQLSEIDILKEGDILVVRSNGNQELIGRCILAQEMQGKISHSGFTIRIRLNSQEVFPHYLCHYLKSNKARKNLTESGAGASIKSLNQVALSSLEIPLPPLPEQEKIVARLDATFAHLERLHAAQQARLARLEALKGGILKEAFEGKL